MADVLEKAQVWIYRRPSAGEAASGRSLEVLLLRTHPRVEYGEFWQPVTGSVEPGERPCEGAARETREETGLTEVDGRLRPLGFEFNFMGRGRVVHETAYSFGIAKDENPQIRVDPREHSRYEWVSPEEALARLPFESNRRALQILLIELGPAKP